MLLWLLVGGMAYLQLTLDDSSKSTARNDRIGMTWPAVGGISSSIAHTCPREEKQTQIMSNT